MDVSGRDIGVRRLNRRRQLRDRHAVGGQPIALDADADLADIAAEDIDRRDIGRLLQAFDDDVVRQNAQIARAVRAAHRQVHDRLRAGVLLQDDRAVRLCRQKLAHGVDLLPQVRRRRVQVRADVELAGDRRNALLRCGGDLTKAADAGDRILDRLGDQRLHLLRTGARVGRGDRDHAEIDLGIQLGGQLEIADEPQADQGEYQHQNCDGAMNRQSGDTHNCSPSRAV